MFADSCASWNLKKIMSREHIAANPVKEARLWGSRWLFFFHHQIGKVPPFQTDGCKNQVLDTFALSMNSSADEAGNSWQLPVGFLYRLSIWRYLEHLFSGNLIQTFQMSFLSISFPFFFQRWRRNWWSKRTSPSQTPRSIRRKLDSNESASEVSKTASMRERTHQSSRADIAMFIPEKVMRKSTTTGRH